MAFVALGHFLLPLMKKKLQQSNLKILKLRLSKKMIIMNLPPHTLEGKRVVY
jgi:hypothetical protein